MPFQLMLAPMEGYTGPAMRSFCAANGADVTFTEMARIDSLAKRNRSTLARISIPDGTPTVIQVFGNKEDKLAEFLKGFEPSPGFYGFNLNCSCPAPSLVQRGLGAAMMRRISKVARMIRIIQDRGYQASVKLRLGLNEADKRNKVYMNLINGVDADLFILHARHALQTYNESADFKAFKIAKQSGKRIVANGDISTEAQIEELKSLKLYGAMIGRAAVTGPLIFARLKGLPMPERPFDSIRELSDRFHENPIYMANILKAASSADAAQR